MDERLVLAALRGERSTAEICAAAGIDGRDLNEARSAFLQRRLPPTESRLRAAVTGPVDVLRDRAGVPHIFASTTADLYFGLGVATGQDRLWQIDRLRRRAQGRQAEVMGASYVASDLIHRTVDIAGIAAAEVARTDEATLAILRAYVAGLNRQIEAFGRDLPVEFAMLDYEPEPFTVADSIAILRGLWWSLNGRLENIVAGEAASLLSDDALRTAWLTPEAPEHRILPPGSPYHDGGTLTPANDARLGMGDSLGSNNWAVAGSRTPGGRALLAGDPHQPFWIPSSWYEYGLHGPEDDAAGSGHPGVPGLWWGLNGRIAWAITNNNASTRDLYREVVHPDDAEQYRDGGDWRRFDVREERIAVRGGDTVTHRVRSTVRGPILNPCLPSVAEGGDPPLSLRWVGQEHLDDVRALVTIGRASDWPGFRSALRDWSVAVFNFVYADADGRAGYQCAGRVPVRGRVARGYRDADRAEDRWQGYIPFDALPRVEEPPRGYVASANQRAAPDDFPHPMHGAWAAGHRGVRLDQALGGTPALSTPDMVALQNDVLSTRAERLCPHLLRRLAAVDDSAARELRARLAGWDYRYTVDSVAATLFEAFMRQWQGRVAAARFPARLLPLVRAASGLPARLIEADDLDWFDGDKEAELAAAARDTVAELRGRLGDDAGGWRWGALHTVAWRHPLSHEATGPDFDIGPVEVDGCGETVRNTGSGVAVAYSAESGAEYRIVVDFERPTQFLAVQNIGNSGQPGSPHYRDQFAAWVAGEYHTVHLTRAGIEADLAGLTRLEPV